MYNDLIQDNISARALNLEYPSCLFPSRSMGLRGTYTNHISGHKFTPRLHVYALKGFFPCLISTMTFMKHNEHTIFWIYEYNFWKTLMKYQSFKYYVAILTFTVLVTATLETDFLETTNKAQPMKGLTASGVNTPSFSSVTTFSYAQFRE